MVKKRVTQVDIARATGVSQATVSQVLSNKSLVGIPAETHQRIFEAASALGYAPDVAARSLRTGKTLTIASVIPDITNPFYPEFQHGIQSVTDDHGYDLILYNTGGGAEKERKSLHSLHERRVDGAIVVLFHMGAARLRDLLETGTAIVRLVAKKPDNSEWPLDNLYLNNEAAAHAATTYLIGRGHHLIAFIGGELGPSPERARGYRRALSEAGLRVSQDLMRLGNFTFEGGRQAAHELLALPGSPTAVFAANDLMALGALAALREVGLHAPDDLAVMGFDDLPASSLVSPALTTVTQFSNRLGHRAAEMLFEHLAGVVSNQGRSEEAPFELCLRESA